MLIFCVKMQVYTWTCVKGLFLLLCQYFVPIYSETLRLYYFPAQMISHRQI